MERSDKLSQKKVSEKDQKNNENRAKFADKNKAKNKAKSDDFVKADRKNNGKARFEKLYVEKLRPNLKETLKLANIMEVPIVKKVVLNVGVKEAVADSRVIQTVMQTLGAIAGQMPVKTLARKSIAGFKIRENMPIGVMVTLRRRNMYEFLDKLINLALPKVRDFQGVPTKLDDRGNYNLGVKEWNIFPEAESNIEKNFGLNITIVTTAKNNEQGLELLKSFGMPFKKK